METTQNEEKKQWATAKICIYVCIISFISPLMICDLYFGFSGDECLNEYPPQIHLNLKKYLLGCGFISLLNIIYMFIIMNFISMNDEKNSFIILMNMGVSYVVSAFLLIWNIMGAIIFWQFIFPEHTCNEELSNYLFASIIIKLVITWGSMNIRKHQDD